MCIILRSTNIYIYIFIYIVLILIIVLNIYIYDIRLYYVDHLKLKYTRVSDCINYNRHIDDTIHKLRKKIHFLFEYLRKINI